MARRDIVTIGASAGGVEALIALVAGLPADFPAAVFVVLHISPYAESRLPEILQRAGPLPAAHAEHGEPIRPGRIYIAPPDRHLLVRPGRVELSRGPRENRSRPAVDPLFRSAARAYGTRAIGVILSGALYDGSAGMLALKARGGTAIVQDPDQAMVDAMPRSALRLAEVDYVARVEEMGALLATLVSEPVSEGETMADTEERITTVIGELIHAQARDGRANEVTIYTCPDCGGALFQDGSPVANFRCHVGHVYAPEVLLGAKAEEVEGALWACVRMLTEKATLTRQLATRTREQGTGAWAERIEEQAEADERHVQVIRQLLETLPGPPEEMAAIIGADGDVSTPSA
jgi:two-component system chemotaxis response regulator CheB